MSSQGFLRGFRVGHHLMDDTLDGIENKRRYDESVERNEQRYQHELGRQKVQDERATTLFNQGQIDRKSALKDKEYSDKQAKKQHLRVDREYQRQQRELRNIELQTEIANAFKADPTGANISQEKVLQWQEKAKGTSSEVLFDINKQQANQFLVQAMQTGFKDVDDERIRMATDTYLKGQITRHLAEGVEDKNGVPIQDIVFAGWETHPSGGLIANVQVTNQNGETYEAPVTDLRSAETDDPIRVYNAEKLMDHMLAENQLINILSKSGYLAKLNAPNLSLTNSKPTKEMQNAQFSVEHQGTPLGEAMDAQIMQAKGGGLTARKEAIKMAKEHFTDPYTSQPKWINSQGQLVEPNTQGARPATSKDIMQLAQRYENYLMNGEQGSNQQPSPQPKQYSQQEVDQLIAFANEAIQKGADPEKVKAKLLNDYGIQVQ